MKIVEQKQKLKKKIKQAKSIFIMAHADLDLDALGSSIGLYIILSKMHKNCFLIIDDKKHELGVGKILQELDGCLNIITSDKIEENLYIRECKNLLIILDTNKQELVQSKKALDYFSDENRIIIDHHDLGVTSISSQMCIIDNQTSSTCEMISNLMEACNLKIDSYYATLLLAGIILDTNNFTLKTTANTYYAAYYLAALGASPRKVQYLLKQDIKDYTERQKVITNVDIIDGKIAIAKGSSYTIYRKEELAKIADTLLFFNDIEVSFVLGKIKEKTVYISSRSLGKYDIAELLEPLGGGGDNTGGAAKLENYTISKAEQKLLQILKNQED